MTRRAPIAFAALLTASCQALLLFDGNDAGSSDGGAADVASGSASDASRDGPLAPELDASDAALDASDAARPAFACGVAPTFCADFAGATVEQGWTHLLKESGNAVLESLDAFSPPACAALSVGPSPPAGAHAILQEFLDTSRRWKGIRLAFAMWMGDPAVASPFAVLMNKTSIDTDIEWTSALWPFVTCTADDCSLVIEERRRNQDATYGYDKVKGHAVNASFRRRTWTEVEIVADGSQLEVFFDTVRVYAFPLSASDWGFAYPTFELGVLYSGEGHVRVDNVRATPLVPE